VRVCVCVCVCVCVLVHSQVCPSEMLSSVHPTEFALLAFWEKVA
jgi:hypothetical protein